MRNSVRDPRVLAVHLHLAEFPVVETAFPLRVPAGMLAAMRPGTIDDPVLRQVLPDARETLVIPDYQQDPVGDLAAARAPGFIQKYQGRALLILTGACPVHCRYCFRRHFPYDEHTLWQPEIWLEMLRSAPDTREVIFSGGDPLMLPDSKLAALTAALAEIPHIQRLRIHSRMPVITPQRITHELLAWLAGTRLKPVLVTHVNHAQELTPAAAHALRTLAMAGVLLLNQSVLLRGVNDHADTLAELSEALLDCQVRPYYLHQLDKVAGAAHFAVADAHAMHLLHTLRQRLPGYLVPALVREHPGADYKRPLAPASSTQPDERG